MADAKNEPLYTPRQVHDECLRVGTFALTTLQCALITAVYFRKSTSKAPQYQHARRTLAAWLSDDEWHRHTFKLKTLGPWHEIYEQLHRKGIMDLAGQFESPFYPPAPDYELTGFGQTVAELLAKIVPPPLSGKAYEKYIERQRELSRKKKAEKKRKRQQRLDDWVP